MADSNKAPSSTQRGSIVITALAVTGLPLIHGNVPNGTHIKVEIGDQTVKTGIFDGPSQSLKWPIALFVDPDSVTLVKFFLYRRNRAHITVLLGSTEIPVASLLPGVEELSVQFFAKKSATPSTLVIRYGTNLKGVASERMVSSAPLAEGLDPSCLSTARDGAENIAQIVSTFDFLKSVQDFKEMFDRLAQIHPMAGAAWSLLTIGIDVMEAQYQKDKGMVDLHKTMVHTFGIASQQDAVGELGTLKPTFDAMIRLTIECQIFISGYTSKGYLPRLFKLDIPKKTAEFRQGFVDLEAQFNGKLNRNVAIVTLGTHKAVEFIERDLILKKLNPHRHLLPREKCLLGTRTEPISYIISWIANMNGGVLLLTGLPGMGKSTVMSSIADAARHLGNHSRLGAYIRFDVKRMNDPTNVITTIAYRLASFDVRISDKISDAIKKHLDFEEMSMQEQFETLLVEPLRAIEELGEEGPIVVLVDALDECEASDARTTLFKVLAGGFGPALPFMRLIVASRALSEITAAFNSQKNAHIHSYSLDNGANATERDNKLYFTERFRELGNAALDKLCAEHNAIQELTRRARGLFIWAVTTYTYIERSPRARLLRILETKGPTEPEAALDAIYHVALNADLGDSGANKDIKKDMRTILGAVLVVENPPGLLRSAIDDLLLHDTDSPSEDILPKLACVISYGIPQDPLRTIHTSFSDFLLDKSRSGDDWHVDIGEHNKQMALFCLRTLGMHFDQNGSDLVILTSSAAVDTMIMGDAHSYACQFWVVHACKLEPNDIDVNNHLDVFFQRHFLMWLYSMGRLKFSEKVLPSMLRLLEHTNEGSCSATSRKLRYDAFQFAEQFILDVHQDPLSVFSTGLSFCPGDNSLPAYCLLSVSCLTARVMSACFYPDGTKFVAVCDSKLCFWNAQTGAPLSDPMMCDAQIGTVLCAKISPDGSKLVSGSYDGLVIIWDALTGVRLADCNFHTAPVWTVGFSPDSSKVVSAGEDASIRVWDVFTGLPILEPICGHTNRILCVVFSPDGKTILSGADDSTIRMWDALTGDSLLEPIDPRTNVKSVAFSPDGSKFVSGSEDNMICVWDTATGTPLLQPLCGHKAWVTSVAFFEDGAKILSCGDDSTFRVWDSITGNLLLTAYANTPISVQASPDDTKILCASFDRTARIRGIPDVQNLRSPSQNLWNRAVADLLKSSTSSENTQADNIHLQCVACSPTGDTFVLARGKTVEVWDLALAPASLTLGPNPILGLSAAVFTVAYSPMGDLVASGAHDGTIQLWDARTWSSHGETFQGHNDVVRSLSFSSKSARLVSASHDGTVRVWDVATGKEVFDAIRGPWSVVRAVVFSPDDTMIASGGNDCEVHIWNASTGESLHELCAHTGGVSYIVWSPDGKTIASASSDGTVKLWDFPGFKDVREFRAHAAEPLYVAFWPDGSNLLVALSNGMIHAWNVSNGQPPFEPIHAHNHLFCAALRSDASKILTGSLDKTLRVWDAQTGVLLATPIDRSTLVTSFCFNADIMALAVVTNHSIHVWRSSTVTRPYNPLEGHEGRVVSMSLNASGSKLVSASEDTTFIMWDLVVGEALYRIEAAHSGVLTSVRFSPDGLKLATGSSDMTVKLWDALHGAPSIPEVPIVSQSGRVVSVGFSPDSRHIVSASLDHTLDVWDTLTGAPIFSTNVMGGPLAGVIFSADGQSLIYASTDGIIYTCSFRPTLLYSPGSMPRDTAQRTSLSASKVLVKFPHALRTEITAMYLISDQFSAVIRTTNQLITVTFP